MLRNTPGQINDRRKMHACADVPASRLSRLDRRRRYDLYVLAEVHRLTRPATPSVGGPSKADVSCSSLSSSMVNKTLSADEDADVDGEAFVERSSRELMRLT